MYSNKAKNIDIQFKDTCIKIECTKFKKIRRKFMKKNLLLLTLGILAVCQLGYSENTDVKVEKTQMEDVKQTQDEVKTNEMENTENTETELKQSQEQEAEETKETNQAPRQVQKEAPKTKRLTPEQERRLEAKAKRNKEKNMTLDEKLDLQILKMERLLKSLEGK